MIDPQVLYVDGASRSRTVQWAFAFDWPIFLDLMEYAKKIQELTERPVSCWAFGCTLLCSRRMPQYAPIYSITLHIL